MFFTFLYLYKFYLIIKNKIAKVVDYATGETGENMTYELTREGLRIALRLEEIMRKNY